MFFDPIYFEHAESSRAAEDGLLGRFVPVAEEETAFALSLFVGAANGELAEAGPDDLPAESAGECNRLLWALSRRSGEMRGEAVRAPHLRSLDVAFRTLWKHYEGDERQTSVCARVLGFCSLMEETEGGLVEGWVSSCPDTEEVVVLHPAVVATLACVPLTREGMLRKAEFVARLGAHAM